MDDEIRRQITELVADSFALAYPTIPLVTDNEPFNWDSPPEAFVEFEVELLHGAQIGMSSRPKTRISGYVYISVKVREGTGAALAAELRSWFSSTLEYQSTDLVRLQAAARDGSSRSRGWYFLDLKVPFYADSP